MKRILRRPFSMVTALACLALGPVCAEIPEVTVYRLTQMLEGDLSPEERADATRKLAGAKLASGDAEGAAATLRDFEGEAPLLRARIAMGLGQWKEALTLLETAGDRSLPFAVGEAECLRRLGRHGEAVVRLREAAESAPGNTPVRLLLAETLLDLGEGVEGLETLEPAPGFETKWLAYLRGRVALLDDEAAAAAGFFTEVLADRAMVNPPLFAGATLGMAEAYQLLDRIDEGVTALEEFIWRNPQSPQLEEVFAKLDQFYERQEYPESDPLFKLALEQPPSRAALAAYYLARARVREGNPVNALVVLESLTGQNFDEPIIRDALVLQAQLSMERGLPAEDLLRKAMPLAGTEQELAQIEMLIGMAQFRERDFVQAAISFHNAADHSPALAERAIFNAALAWLYQGNQAQFLNEYAAMSTTFPESSLRQELILEQGLIQAREGQAGARGTLERFLRDFSGNPRVGEARVALAELAYAGEPGGRDAAAQYLRVVNEGSADPESLEQADCLAIYLEEGNAEAIAAAKRFLKTHPGSSLLPKVRMKLGELYFAAGDLANARTQFEMLAADSPDSGYAGPALFLAAQAAAKMMDPGRALELFEQVVALEGPLALYARAEQAAVKTRLGEENEAIILYDSILRSDPPADLLAAAMIGKGDNQFLTGANDPAQYAAAGETFGKLAALPDVQPRWKYQALFKQGKAYEKLGQTDAALTAFTAVLEDGKGSPDTTWIFRAGFDAARILETRERWESAARIYGKMAELGGSRSEEARKLLTQLKLEHFLWE